MSRSDPVTVKIGVSDYVSTSHFPILLAQELGLYEKEGLKVVVRAYEQAAKALDALRDGDIDLASVAEKLGGSRKFPRPQQLRSEFRSAV